VLQEHNTPTVCGFVKKRKDPQSIPKKWSLRETGFCEPKFDMHDNMSKIPHPEQGGIKLAKISLDIYRIKKNFSNQK
jgi:hypothetical protein